MIDVLSRHEETFSSPNPFVNPSPLNWANWQHPPRKKVALIGFEEQNNQTAPLDDPDWDVWGFNMGNRLGIHADSRGRFRADRWFDLHQEHAQDYKDMAWINACPVPIYLVEPFGTNRNARGFVIEDIQKAMPEVPMYFASSFAMAFAMALAEGYETIGLFGIGMDWGRERVVERGNLEFWMGVALGKGLTVQLSDRHKLLTHPGIYGLEYDKEATGTKVICGQVMRQLLQSPDMKGYLEQDLEARMEAMERIKREATYLLDCLMYKRRPEEEEVAR